MPAESTDEERKEALWQAMRDELEATYADIRRSKSPKLFHYTTTQAAISIIERGELWATHFRYLNDPREFIEGEQAFLQALKEAQSRRPRRADVLDPLCERYDQHSLSNRTDSYVVSFSTRPDSLSQWRAYAAGGSGCCLGFESVDPWDDPKESETRTWAPTLHECIYDRDKFLQRCTAALEAVLCAFETVEGVHKPQSALLVQTAHRHILQLGAYLTPQLKDSGYVEEAEWRLIALVPPRRHDRIHFRPHPLTTVPYFKLPMAGPGEQMKLSALTIGPMQDQERGDIAAQMLLERYGYSSDLVFCSRLQMR
jgi:hypothetical protein